MSTFTFFQKYRTAGRPATATIGVLLLTVSLYAHADDMQDANKLFKQGQYAPALAKVDAYLAGKPKDAQARFLKGLILTEQGKSAEAIKVFSALTEDYPELPEPYNNLAVLHASQGQYDKAKQSLEMAIRTHPSYATAHENLGDIYAKMASQAYDRALQLDRSNTATQTKLAMIQDLFAGGSRGKSAATPAVAKAEAATSKPAPIQPEPAKPVPTKVEPAKPTQVKIEPAPAKAPPVKPEPATPPATASTAKPAAQPTTKETETATGSKDEILRTVYAWADAWSSQDVPKYLAFYAGDFRPQDGMTRAAWEAQRKERVSKPKSIKVGISNPVVKLDDETHATVQFRQSYRADKLKIPGSKTLLMVKNGGKWLIQEERAK